MNNLIDTRLAPSECGANWEGRMRLASAVGIAVLLAGCATTFENGETEKVFRFPDYDVTMERNGCLIKSAKLHSKTKAIDKIKTLTLLISTKTETSSTRMVICPPVGAGGVSLCKVSVFDEEAPAYNAGIGCPEWDSFKLNE